jgi:signal transduction histidine kinase
MQEQGIANLEDLLRQQEILREVIESISSELELRPLLTRIARSACELLGADNGTIGLVDEKRQTIRTEAAYRMPADELGAEAPFGAGLFGEVLRTQKPVVLNRYGDVEKPTQLQMLDNAVIGVPIFWRDRILGAFGLGSPLPHRFTEHDVEVLSLFARHAAIAIVNARRYEQEHRRTERLALIARIGHIITADLQLGELLQNAADAIHDLLGYPNIAIPLIDPEEPETLVLRTVGGYYRELIQREYRLPISDGIIGAAARERRVQIVNDVESDPRYLPAPGAVGIRAEVAVPILLGEKVLGVLNVESGSSFTEEDAASLAIIADQLAVAIENARLFAGAKSALDEMQLLYATSRRISTAMDIDEVVAAYLEQVAARGRYACSVALYEMDEAGKKTAVLVRGRWTRAEGMDLTERRHPHTLDDLDPPLDAGQTITITDVHTDPRCTQELRQIQKRAKRPALAMVPLIVRGERIGVVVLSYPKPYVWREADLRPYQATAVQLATAIDSRRQYLLLAERGQQVAVLEERQRLARELHDSVTQLLFSVTLIAQSIGPAWRRDPEEGERRVQRLLELSQSALAEMRALLVELRPPDTLFTHSGTNLAETGIERVRREGLPAALRRHAENVARDGLRIDLKARAYRRQPSEVEEALYRITQEALNNVVKHARARRVEIRLGRDNDSVRLTVKDDGVGFAPQTPGAVPTAGLQSRFGLTNMRERAEALGGSLHIHSSPGSGTLIEATLPHKD